MRMNLVYHIIFKLIWQAEKAELKPLFGLMFEYKS